MSYAQYLKDIETYKKADSIITDRDKIGTIIIDADDENNIVAEMTDAKYQIQTFDGIEAILTPDTGTVTWKVTNPLEKKALYTITLVYYAYVEDDLATRADAVERVFKINGTVPFSEARYLSIKKNWRNDYVQAVYTGDGDIYKIHAATPDGLKGEIVKNAETGKNELRYDYPGVWTTAISKFCEEHNIRFFKLDYYGNELRPAASQKPIWSDYALSDSMGFYTEPFTFVLEPGENYISLEGKNSNLAISEIILAPAQEPVFYSDYLEMCKGQPAGSGVIKIEAEYTDTASDKTIYPIEDAADALTSPHSPSKTLLNTMGGEKWQTAGQSVTYRFKVDKSGMYDIAARFKQNVLDGMFVNRSLLLYSEGIEEGKLGYYNGAPFEEAKAITFNYGDDWQVTKATDGETNFKFYFEEGVTYTIKLEVTLGSMADIVNTVQDALDHINADYLSIIQLTGSSPDTYRDYGFSRIMPDVIIDMYDQGQVLDREHKDPAKRGVAQKLTELAGEKSSNVGTLQKIADLLLTMSQNEEEIARLLPTLKSYIGTLGTFLSDAKTQPLQLDYITIQGTDEEMPQAKANIFEFIVHEVSRFFWSFFRDYDAVGVLKPVEDGEALEVWLATGRDQFQVKRNLVNSGFVSATEERPYDIPVELKLVAAGTLLPSILAGQGPDVYHGLDQGSVINYAIRSAVLPLDGFDDFYEFVKIDPVTGEIQEGAPFNESAMIVLRMDNAAGEIHYYGLPESQGFSMMFVRVDILADLGIDVPRTWDDIMAAIPKLQSKNMQIGLPTDNTIHLYQMGGELFADNGMRINLDSQIGLESFEKTCDLFTKYGFPYQYDGANRFRTGEMPIIIADYTGLYNQLKVFATEIDGSWVMVPVPGVERDGEDGYKIYNDAIAAVTASVRVRGADDSKADWAWEYIKWFTGDECQADYSNEMVALLGPSAKYNTANRNALEKLPWTKEELQRIQAQFDNLAAVPNYPGRYILARYTEFAFLAAYNDRKDPQDAIRKFVPDINDEITRKRAEFGLETLAVGQTLASKRLDQAVEAAAELKSRNSKYKTVYDEITGDIVKSNDSAYIKAYVAELLVEYSVTEEMLEGDALIAKCDELNTSMGRISTGLDLDKLNETKLVSYVAVALHDAAMALDTYK